MSDETPAEKAARLRLEKVTREIGGIIGDAVRQTAGPGVGFCLMLFDFGPRGALSYLSNAERDDMIKVLDEFKTRLLRQ
jgi:hypothetical protein